VLLYLYTPLRRIDKAGTQKQLATRKAAIVREQETNSMSALSKDEDKTGIRKDYTRQNAIELETLHTDWPPQWQQRQYV
jgi:hypothetical protein